VKTKLISEQDFSFEGMDDSTAGSSMKDAIHAAHRRHMEDFKIFAERVHREQGN
jgi:hypothetical protein